MSVIYLGAFFKKYLESTQDLVRDLTLIAQGADPTTRERIIDAMERFRKSTKTAREGYGQENTRSS